MKLRRTAGVFAQPARLQRRVIQMATPDLKSWANTTMVALWQAVERLEFDEAKVQMGILNDILVELERRDQMY